MIVSTVLLLLTGGVIVHAQQFEPFNENSISLDGLFDEEFDSINPISPPPPNVEDTTVAPLTTVPPVGSIKVFDGDTGQAIGPVQSGQLFDEVEFPPEGISEETTKEETREESGERRERPEEGKRGISIYRPVEGKSNEKKKKSGSTGWSHKRKRLVRKGAKILRARWSVVPENISTLRPHLQRKRRILPTRISHVKPVRPPRVDSMTSMKTRAVFRPASLPRMSKTHFLGTRDGATNIKKKKKGISRSRPKEMEGRGPKVQSHSDRPLLSRVARTDERSEKTLREQQSRTFKLMKDALNRISDSEINENRQDQIQVQSAARRFEYALDRNALPRITSTAADRNSLLHISSPFRPLSSSSFSHFSPRPLLLPPLRTTQLHSGPRHRLNAHSPPVLLHRLHDGDWKRLRLLEGKRKSEGSKRRVL